MKFTTESGSSYEVNGCQIRRVGGINEPTLRQGKDGDWKEAKMILVSKGQSAVIFWGEDTFLLPNSPSESIPATITSKVVEIID